MGADMTAIGIMTSLMDRGEEYILIGVYMRGVSSMVNLKGKVDHKLYISIHLGVINCADGTRYTGNFIGGLMHGQGIIKW